MQTTADAPDARLPAWQVAAGSALAYAAVGAVALLLSLPPGYAAPLYPSAGVALVAALIYGPAALVGVFFGAFSVNALLGDARGLDPVFALLVPLSIAIGATLQALAGAALVRRCVPQPLVLGGTRDVMLAGLLGGPVACVVSAGFACAALWLTGTLDSSQLALSAATWWAGDALGVTIGGPLAMTLVGRPAAAWRPRRRTVALPLLIVTVLLVGVTLALERSEQRRIEADFEHDARSLASEAERRLQVPLQALQAVAGAKRAAGGRIDAALLDDAADWWLAQPIGVEAISWAERVRRDGIGPFVARQRAAGDAGFTVFARGPAPPGDAVVLRLITPLQANRRAVGVDVTTIPATQAALARARDSGAPTASAAFRLTQAQPQSDDSGLVVYLPVYDGPATTAQERAARFTGVLGATMRPARLLAGLHGAHRMRWCLLDAEPGVERPQIAGGPACGASDAQTLVTRVPIAFASRQLELLVEATPDWRDGRRQLQLWALVIAGLAAASLLGALLLTVTGRAYRIGLAVDERSAELRREVAERRRAEEEIRAAGERLRAIVDSVPIGVMFLDLEGRLLEANPWLGTMLGRPPGELVGRSLDDISHADEHRANRDCIETLLAGRAPLVRRRTRLLRADGQELPAQTSCALLRDAAGQPWRLIGVAEDISEHLRLEESERALHRAEAANRAKTEFLSRMSHELRTPLNAMIGFAQLLGLDREPPLAPHQRDWATQMLRAGWHLLAMINDTLDLARLDAGTIQLDIRPQDLGAVVAASIEMVAAVAERQGVTVDAEIARDAVGVLADDTRLKQVLTNLLSNAVKYNRPGGSVVVSAATAPDGRVTVRVRDSGLGMTPEQLAQLFQPYNRLGREQSGIEGTGIGLVISRRLAELMDGTLEASSVAGRGSEFVLTLPQAEPSGAAAPSTISSPLEPYTKRRVHYIEDNETNVEVMRGVLAQRQQIVLEVSTMGLDGLAAVRQRRPHLILLDMHLPDISGLELLRHLKQDPDVADVPVIVVSADATKARMEEALTLGAAHYVTKPLDVRRFLRTVDEALAAHETRWGL